MSDADDVEYADEFRKAQNFATTSYHSECAARQSRRERVSGYLQTQKSERQAEQDRAVRAMCRPLTSEDVRIYDEFNRVMNDGNAANSREIRQRDLRMKNMDEVLEHDFDGYMQHLSDQHLEMQGFKRPRYKGN